MAKNRNKKDGLTSTDMVLGGVGLLIVGKLLLFPSMSRAEAVQILMAAGHNPDPSFGDDYVIAWARAVKKRLSQFRLGKSIYSTQTGKKIA